MKVVTMAEPTKIVTVAEMQALEKAADGAGHSYATMMELAGRGVAEKVIAAGIAQAQAMDQHAVILVGPGNNGGDGLVCARYLHGAGFSVRVYLWKRKTDRADDYEGHYQKLTTLGVTTAHADDDPHFALLRTWLVEPRQTPLFLVDALLGTGTNRPISGQLADLLTVVKEAIAPREDGLPTTVVAVDCPSGLNADTGEVDAYLVPADETVTFAYAKWGHYHFPGAAACGRLHVIDIGIAPDFAAEVQTFLIDEALVRNWLPKRSNNSHKGTFGKVMVAVGSHNFPGAAYLSCSAAGRVGAGLITGAVTDAVWSVVAGKLPEPTWLPLPTGAGDEAGVIAEAAVPVLLDGLSGYRALIVGCGLNKKPTTVRFMQGLMAAHAQLPATLIDADGLNSLALLDEWPCPLPAQIVLTPHAAEMGRLCNLDVKEVLAQRWQLARTKAAEWSAVVLAKGPYTVIAHPDGRLAVLPIATPALATAGTGDVLSGTIGGLLAQGVPPFDAACAGAWLHGQAGLRCAAAMGTAGVIASDLLPQLPLVLRDLDR